MSGVTRVNADGSLQVRAWLAIPPQEIEVRVTTSGGPGGQHANRSLTKVVVTFDVDASEVLASEDQELLRQRLGAQVRASSSRFRSQGANKSAALEALATKLQAGLLRQAPRRATRPTRASQERRVDEKKSRARIKHTRRNLDD